MLIINQERNPKYSLYHIGAVILNLLLKKNPYEIQNLFTDLNEQYDETLSAEYFHITLDWLFLIDKIEIQENKVWKK